MDLSLLLHTKLTSRDVLFLCDLLQTEWLGGFDFKGFLRPAEKLISQSSLYGRSLPYMCRKNSVWAVIIFKGTKAGERVLFSLSRFTSANFHFSNCNVLENSAARVFLLARHSWSPWPFHRVYIIVLHNGLKTSNSIHHSESVHIHLSPSEMGVPGE